MLSVLACASVLFGCLTSVPKVPPDFATRWKAIRIGMAAVEVHELLTKPPFTSYQPTDSSEHIEYWLFTGTKFSEVPPTEAYVIWFTADWKVKGFRAPGSPPVPYHI